MVKEGVWGGVSRTIGIFSCCAGMSAMSARAQQPSAETDGKNAGANSVYSERLEQDVSLGEVVVTARRTARPLADSFANVTVIHAEEIMSSSANSIPGFLATSEGMLIEDASGVGTSSKIHLRGFTTDMAGYHLVLVDGVPQNSVSDKLVDWNLIPLSNVERIEVVRGPLSTLYGENAMAGVIQIITREPKAQPETLLRASYGSFDTLKLGARTGGAFHDMSYLFSLGHTATDGYRDHGDADYLDLTGKLGFAPDALTRIRSWIQYSEIERGAHPWALSEDEIAEDRHQARPGTEDDTGKNRKLSAGMKYERDVSEVLSLRATGHVRNEEGESFYTSGAGADSTAEILSDESLYGAGLVFTLTPVLRGPPHTLVAGIDVERSTYDYNKYAAPFQVRAESQSDYETERDRVGLYVEDEVRLGERLRLLAGVRHSRLEYDFDDDLEPERNNERTFSEESFRAGASYTYRESGAEAASARSGVLFATLSRAFRSPTLGQMFTYRSSNPDLQPETALNYEIGVRDGIGDAVDLRLSMYWMEVEEEIAYDYESYRYGNYGETTHRGIELGLKARVTPRLGCFVNYTYTDARNESGTYDGKDLPHIPRHMGNLGLEYANGSSWGGRLAARMIGSSYMDDANSARLSSYTTVDLRGWIAAGPLKFFAEIANLFDEDYSTYGFMRSGTGYYSPAPGTTFTTGLSAVF